MCIRESQRRIRINRDLNQQLAPLGAIRLDVTCKASRGCTAQTMLLWPGIVLIGCLAVSKRSLIHISEPTRLLITSYAVFCLQIYTPTKHSSFSPAFFCFTT